MTTIMAVDKKLEGAESGGEAHDRTTLCISSSTPGLTLHGGDAGFSSVVSRHYSSPEAVANEKLCKLKARLPSMPADEFWTEIMEGITDITGSQYALAVRRMLPDDQDAAVEMPEIGDPGECLMATAFFYNDGEIHRNHVRDYKYYPYTGPCSHMKHDKVFVVPANLAHFIGDQIHRFAFPVDTYMGIPLFSPTGECIGHFGALWSETGMQERNLGWGFVEMALHALEDFVAKKLMEGQAFSKRNELVLEKVIPTAVLNAAQSLKPYARSLSHELRTPMQGVVGMLDIMHATVSEALEAPLRPDVAKTFRLLRENIEVVQDSSRRAVEAADNVVHAADLDMQIPETPEPLGDAEGRQHEPTDYISAGKALSNTPGDKKRKRDDHPAPPPSKYAAIDAPHLPPRPLTPRTAAVRSAVRESGHITGVAHTRVNGSTRTEFEFAHSPVTTAAKVTRVRDHIRTVVNECLRYGGRPESALAKDTASGEIIEVRSRDGKGQISEKRIEWSVDSSVPDEIQVDERDFTKLVSVLLLNALKFTQQGRIRLHAQISTASRLLVVKVLDTGTGIPAEFIPNLFKAFSRQDDTITRQSEGLGLGLLVAKGVARKLGGDLRCVRSDTDGPNRGTEFEFKVPLSPSEAPSRHTSPSPSPTPQHTDEPPATLDIHRSTYDTSLHGVNQDVNVPPVSPRQPVRSHPSHKIALPDAWKPVLQQEPVVDPAPPRSPIVRPLPFEFDRHLAQKHPLRFLVAEDNRLNRKLLVTMLGKLGYTAVYEAFDGAEAVRQMEVCYRGDDQKGRVDVILMDLWMPNMDGYEATRRILEMERKITPGLPTRRNIKILAVTADVTDGALDRAKEAGMTGLMTKPYKVMDLERLIVEHCVTNA